MITVNLAPCFFAFATIFTPQGDGNGIPTGEGSKQASDAIRHDIYPARGRKLRCKTRNPQSRKSNSPRYLPRKGTETKLRVL